MHLPVTAFWLNVNYFSPISFLVILFLSEQRFGMYEKMGGGASLGLVISNTNKTFKETGTRK